MGSSAEQELEGEQIHIVIADKNPLVREGLELIFSQDPRFNLIAITTDGQRFLDAVREFVFDVGVIGWEMPYLNGRQVLEALRTMASAPRIVVYTGSADPAVPAEVMTLGGAGFCSKSEPPERLVSTVTEVAAGRMVFPFLDVRSLTETSIGNLTWRERDLLRRLASGQSNRELARALGISVNTVKFHLKNLYEKLSVKNRAQAVAFQMARKNDPR